MKRVAASWIALFAVVACVAWAARAAHDARFRRLSPDDGAPVAGTPWFSAEPDGLYHARRVARALAEGLPPAPRDPAMAFPAGAAIPWPPYYDALLAVVLAPFAPAAASPEARRGFLERTTAALPVWFGVAAALAAAAAGAGLAGRRGALAAGLLLGLSYGAVHYSVPGIADHHAFVGLLLALLLWLTSLALRPAAAASAASGWRLGIAAGLVAGLSLGSWVAGLVHVLVVQAALGAVLLGGMRRPVPAGITRFGLAFHGVALLALLPAVVQSPWRTTSPWMVVNLSWFHPVFLALGGLVFVPLLRFAPDSRWRRWHAPAVAAGLAGLGALLWLLDAGPAAGVREAFTWSARANAFMGDIAESQPLVGVDRYGTGGWLGWLGFAAVVAAGCWLWEVAAPLVRRAFRSRRPARPARPQLLPWLVAFPVFVAQALAQRRFAADAALPIALLAGWGLARAHAAATARLRGGAAIAGWAALVAVAATLQLPTLRSAAGRVAHRADIDRDADSVRQNGLRAAHEWLSAHAVPDASVMAHWDQGHAIEFLTGMGSVATNFGSYVGEESFRDAARFFTATDVERAERILERRRCRYVLAHSTLIWAWPQLREAAEVAGGAAWGEALGGILFRPDHPAAPAGLRLRWISPFPELAPHPRLLPGVPLAPVALIYERVAGARLVVAAEPGQVVELEVPVELADGSASFVFHRTVMAGEDGRARIRSPYAGVAAIRRGAAAAPIEVVVAEDAVRDGVEIAVP